MKRTIAIVCGGDSSEHDVSMRSGAGLYSFFDKERYDIYLVETRGMDWQVHLNDGSRTPIIYKDFSFVENGKNKKFDYAYITIHGAPGENGIMQGYFEMVHVPYSTSNVLVEALTFDKFALNQYLRSFGVSVADSILIRKGEENDVNPADVEQRLGMPVFVKPSTDGSSFGVTKVKKIEDFDEAVKLAFSEGKTMLIEESISGRELQCGVYRQADGSVMALPVIEIVSENEFFDYDAKYNGKSQEICPARITEEERELIQDASRKIYGRLDCSGVVRIDFILSEAGLYFLEINGIPGMTSASLVPQMVRTAGLSMPDFLTDIITITSAK